MTIRPLVSRLFVLGIFAALATSCATTNDTAVVANATSEAPIILDAQIGKAYSADSTRIEGAAEEFAPTDTVFAVVDVPATVQGQVIVRWFFGSSDLIMEQGLAVQPGIHAYRVHLVPGATGHRAGDYRFEVNVGNTVAKSKSFRVVGS